MEKKIRILELIDEFLPSISESIRTVDNYSRQLMDTCDVVVGTTAKVSSTKEFSYKLIAEENIFKLKARLRKVKFDIIHVHSVGKIMDMAIRLGKEKNVSVVATIHEPYIAKCISLYGKGIKFRHKVKKYIATLNKLDELFVPSPYVSEELREYGYVGKVSYLPLASDLDIDMSRKRLIELADHYYELDGVENVLISMGNVRKTKRLDFALKSLAILKKNKVDFEYFIIGGGEEIDPLYELAKKLGISKHVHFLGRTRDDLMCALIARADLLLYPSIYDYYGIAKIECAGFSTAGVYIKDSYVSNEVFDDINGFVSDNNEDEYANAIFRALSSKKHLKDVSSNAYNDLYLDWSKASAMLEVRLREIIDEHTKLTRQLKRM